MSENYLAKERFYWLKVFLDGTFLAIAFMSVYWLRRGDLFIDEDFREFLPIVFLTWFLVTILSKKFKVIEKQDYFSRLQPYWLAAVIFVSLLTLLLYFMGWIHLSRFIVYGTIAIYVILESIFLAFHLLFLRKREPGRPIPFAVFFFLIELAALSAAFYSIYFSKRATFRLEEKYQIALMGLFFVWLMVSLLVHRFKVKTRFGFWNAFNPFWQSEALILGLVSFMVFIAARGNMSRLIIFGSIAGFAVLENIVVLAYYIVSQFKRADEDPAELLADELAHPQGEKGKVEVEEKEYAEEIVKEKYRFQDREDSQEFLKQKLERLFSNKFHDVYDFIKKYVDLGRFDILSSAFLFASNIFNIDIFEDDSLGFFFNFEKVNNFRHVNQVFIALNKKMKQGGVLVGCFESYDQRRQRIFSKFPRWFARFFYIIDFIYKRIMPKLPVLKQIYFQMSQGKKRVFSRTEILGRLYYCGFEVIGLRPINNIYYFIAKKTKEPRIDPRPSYGPVFRQRRLGRGGKIIFIYKLRTMHPFAEYLHQYIFEKNQLEESGKIKGDFRITSWGRFFRKTWLDELPMLVNWLKRDIKLVGVRPLSETFFKTYPEELQKERIKFKPGLIPPFYADMP
ncbi:MAG: sugar transferase, partial [Candidatus Aminicenantes bacterium]|nr:sugar transferase [Candidatus Aminicenantes bacterium]